MLLRYIAADPSEVNRHLQELSLNSHQPPSLLNQPLFPSCIMNIYEIQQGLQEAKLRCAMLEADLEAERAVRKAQEKWLLKYCRIIDKLMDGANKGLGFRV